ncbi:MAG: hypothetical protein L0099_12700 [Acidobacteria bacterium]|nr:hypothetical protein [Acidobacteriota bacterium]
MSHQKAFCWIVTGILISLALPVLSAYVKEIFRPDGPLVASVGLWQYAKPYVVTSLFALTTALLILAYIVKSGGRITSWAEGLLYGFAWDSILQKIASS